jgi:hypothetical protein
MVSILKDIVFTTLFSKMSGQFQLIVVTLLTGSELITLKTRPEFLSQETENAGVALSCAVDPARQRQALS